MKTDPSPGSSGILAVDKRGSKAGARASADNAGSRQRFQQALDAGARADRKAAAARPAVTGGTLANAAQPNQAAKQSPADGTPAPRGGNAHGTTGHATAKEDWPREPRPSLRGEGPAAGREGGTHSADDVGRLDTVHRIADVAGWRQPMPSVRPGLEDAPPRDAGAEVSFADESEKDLKVLPKTVPAAVSPTPTEADGLTFEVSSGQPASQSPDQPSQAALPSSPEADGAMAEPPTPAHLPLPDPTDTARPARKDDDVFRPATARFWERVPLPATDGWPARLTLEPSSAGLALLRPDLQAQPSDQADPEEPFADGPDAPADPAPQRFFRDHGIAVLPPVWERRATPEAATTVVVPVDVAVAEPAADDQPEVPDETQAVAVAPETDDPVVPRLAEAEVPQPVLAGPEAKPDATTAPVASVRPADGDADGSTSSRTTGADEPARQPAQASHPQQPQAADGRERPRVDAQPRFERLEGSRAPAGGAPAAPASRDVVANPAPSRPVVDDPAPLARTARSDDAPAPQDRRQSRTDPQPLQGRASTENWTRFGSDVRAAQAAARDAETPRQATARPVMVEAPSQPRIEPVHPARILSSDAPRPEVKEPEAPSRPNATLLAATRSGIEDAASPRTIATRITESEPVAPRVADLAERRMPDRSEPAPRPATPNGDARATGSVTAPERPAVVRGTEVPTAPASAPRSEPAPNERARPPIVPGQPTQRAVERAEGPAPVRMAPVSIAAANAPSVGLAPTQPASTEAPVTVRSTEEPRPAAAQPRPAAERSTSADAGQQRTVAAPGPAATSAPSRFAGAAANAAPSVSNVQPAARSDSEPQQPRMNLATSQTFAQQVAANAMPLGPTVASVVTAIAAAPEARTTRGEPPLPASLRSGGTSSASTLNIQLQPAHLGLVTARLTATGSQLSIEIQVESNDAWQRLSSESDTIVKALRAVGYDVDRVSVQQSQQSNQPTAQQTASAGREQAAMQNQSEGGGERRQAGGENRNGQQQGPQRGPEGNQERADSSLYI